MKPLDSKAPSKIYESEKEKSFKSQVSEKPKVKIEDGIVKKPSGKTIDIENPEIKKQNSKIGKPDPNLAKSNISEKPGAQLETQLLAKQKSKIPEKPEEPDFEFDKPQIQKVDSIKKDNKEVHELREIKKADIAYSSSHSNSVGSVPTEGNLELNPPEFSPDKVKNAIGKDIL